MNANYIQNQKLQKKKKNYIIIYIKFRKKFRNKFLSVLKKIL